MALMMSRKKSGGTEYTGTLDSIEIMTNVGSSSYACICENGTHTITSSGLPTIPSTFFCNLVANSDNSLVLTYRTAGRYFETVNRDGNITCGIVERNAGDTVTISPQATYTYAQILTVKVE